jgi:pilin isopeptide linkage protein/LPXTG-motif cell wall-anchored protein
MRKKHTKFMMGSLILIICLALLTPVAMAVQEAVPETINAFMPAVSVTLTGAPQQDSEDYEILLEADDPAFPMPEGSEEGVYKLIITGDDMAILPAIQFSSIGVYTYSIRQTPGTNDLGNYDDSEFNITVYITNAPANGGFESTVTTRKSDEEEKLFDIEFVNDYEIELPDEETPGGEIELPDEEIPGADADPPEPSDVPKTGDESLIWPYILSFIVASILLTVLGLIRKKKTSE